MLYVYGVVDSPSFDGTSVKGHDGASVFAVPCGDCAAAASSLSRRMIAPSPRSVWLHQQVLDELRRLRGKVEFALRVTNTHAECPHARDAERKDDATQALPPGTRYLRERIASEDTARRIERALRRHLDPAAEHAVWALTTTRAPTLTASYLIERNDVSSFVATVVDVRARHPALDVSCTGPWAPYSFVTVRAPEAW